MPHRGVALDDPRNRGILGVLQPAELTADSITVRLVRAYRGKPPANLAEIVARVLNAPKLPPLPPSQSLDAVADRLYGLGTHPDLVERLWALNAGLPSDCRWVVYGYPALVHPESGVVFAAAMGTIVYALRLPNAPGGEPDPPAANTPLADPGPKWSGLLLSSSEWRLGRWRSEEPEWCLCLCRGRLADGERCHAAMLPSAAAKTRARRS